MDKLLVYVFLCDATNYFTHQRKVWVFVCGVHFYNMPKSIKSTSKDKNFTKSLSHHDSTSLCLNLGEVMLQEILSVTN